jgi:hypothetical protein
LEEDFQSTTDDKKSQNTDQNSNNTLYLPSLFFLTLEIFSNSSSIVSFSSCLMVAACAASYRVLLLF